MYLAKIYFNNGEIASKEHEDLGILKNISRKYFYAQNVAKVKIYELKCISIKEKNNEDKVY